MKNWVRNNNTDTRKIEIKEMTFRLWLRFRLEVEGKGFRVILWDINDNLGDMDLGPIVLRDFDSYLINFIYLCTGMNWLSNFDSSRAHLKARLWKTQWEGPVL